MDLGGCLSVVSCSSRVLAVGHAHGDNFVVLDRHVRRVLWSIARLFSNDRRRSRVCIRRGMCTRLFLLTVFVFSGRRYQNLKEIVFCWMLGPALEKKSKSGSAGRGTSPHFGARGSFASALFLTLLRRSKSAHGIIQRGSSPRAL